MNPQRDYKRFLHHSPILAEKGNFYTPLTIRLQIRHALTNHDTHVRVH